jgi:branched-chain amino acid transport system ATP-binding protein
VLRLEKVSSGYGPLEIIKGIDITVNEGEIVTIIGNNGAGKTTTLRSICGLVQLRKGNIRFNDEPINQLPTHRIVAKGIIMVPEGRRIFQKLTVRENLNMGAYLIKDKNQIKEDMERVFQLFPRLKERQKQNGGSLSGGEQQMLAMGRALMGHPKVLLLDEPSMGLAPAMVEKIFDTTIEINKQGTTILLVEQNAFLALQVASRGYVIETGRITISGQSKDLLVDERVKKAYLGEA